MDLGIAGRRAIVCASSHGLGRSCAMALAREGVAVVVNGRNAEVVEMDISQGHISPFDTCNMPSGARM